MEALEAYMQDLRHIRYSEAGTDELTYYHPLLKLLNEVGRELNPRVKALGNLADQGAGHPDIGLFAESQAAGALPERGTVAREYTPAEQDALAAGAAALGLDLDQALNLLGEATYDVHLNDLAFWRNVPAGVWDYTIGGYQVIKKWLSYRERPLLERDLKLDEVLAVTAMVRRIAALLLLGPALDGSYRAVKGAVWEWGS
jgi:hypothetical protein